VSTLLEIEAATERLSLEQKQELLLFLASSLRSSGVQLPAPRQLASQDIASWIAEDEADLKRFREQA
jgi:hypothetical protein